MARQQLRHCPPIRLRSAVGFTNDLGVVLPDEQRQVTAGVLAFGCARRVPLTPAPRA